MDAKRAKEKARREKQEGRKIQAERVRLARQEEDARIAHGFELRAQARLDSVERDGDSDKLKKVKAKVRSGELGRRPRVKGGVMAPAPQQGVGNGV